MHQGASFCQSQVLDRLISHVVLCLILILPGASRAAKFEVTEEKLFSLRSLGQIEISNLRGSVELQSWGLEKLKVKARKWVEAPDNSRLKDIQVKMVEKSGEIRIFTDFTKGLTLPQRYKDRESSTSGVDFVVFAPPQMKVKILIQKGRVLVRDWKNDLSIRAEEGDLQVASHSSEHLSLQCPKCEIRLFDVNASTRVLGGEGVVQIQNLTGKEHFFDAFSGGITAKNLSGQSLLVTKSGNIDVKAFQGGVSFQSEGGNVSLLDGRGRVTGSTREGNVYIRIFDWLAGEPSFVESVSGSVTLMAPDDFSGEVELRSAGGKIRNDFDLKSKVLTQGVVKGVIRGASGFLRLESQDGDVRLSKISSN